LFWAIFDLKIGLLAKNDVGCSAPDLKKRLGAEFPECMFFSRTPVSYPSSSFPSCSCPENMPRRRSWGPKPHVEDFNMLTPHSICVPSTGVALQTKKMYTGTTFSCFVRGGPAVPVYIFCGLEGDQ